MEQKLHFLFVQRQRAAQKNVMKLLCVSRSSTNEMQAFRMFFICIDCANCMIFIVDKNSSIFLMFWVGIFFFLFSPLICSWNMKIHFGPSQKAIMYHKQRRAENPCAPHKYKIHEVNNRKTQSLLKTIIHFWLQLYCISKPLASRERAWFFFHSPFFLLFLVLCLQYNNPNLIIYGCGGLQYSAHIHFSLSLLSLSVFWFC